MTFYHDNFTRQSSMLSMDMQAWPGRTYRYLQVPHLYCFGHGLSYVTFQYAGLLVEQDPTGNDATTWLARVNVTNTGGALQPSSAYGCLRTAGPLLCCMHEPQTQPLSIAWQRSLLLLSGSNLGAGHESCVIGWFWQDAVPSDARQQMLAKPPQLPEGSESALCRIHASR